MTTSNVNPTELIDELAKELQKVETIKAPDWASFVKTGSSRERPPARADWWYVRAASVLRKVNIKGPIGISKLRVLYGGKKNRGHQPEQFRKSSGNILRKILQQLEKSELVKQEKKKVHRGRIITPKGIKLLNGTAKKLFDSKPVKEVPKSQKSKISEGLETKSQSPVEVKPAEKKEAPKPVEKKAEVKPVEVKKEEKPIKEAPKEKKGEEKVPTAAELAEKKK